MLTPWRQWCRLCAQTSSSIGIFSKNEHNCNLAELILKYIHLRVDSLDALPLTICTACYQFVMSVAKFADQASRVDRMYASLACNDLNSSDPSCIKYQFGVVKEEPVNCYNKCDQSTDTLDLYFEWEEARFDPLAVPDDKKEEMELDVSINDLSDIVNDDSNNSISSCDITDNLPSESEESPKRMPLKKFADEPKILAKSRSKTKPSSKCKVQSFPCDICDQSFPKRSALGLHKKTVHAPDVQKEFPCEQCNRKFPTRTRLKNHIATHIHPDQRDTIPCTQCDHVFKSRNNLRQHLRRIHLNDRPFVCEVCGKSFLSESELKNHKYSHATDTPYKCSTCNKQFTSSAGFKLHVDIHSETTYECPICSVVLNTKRSLQKHMVVHSDERKYKCTVCGLQFKRMKTLKNHLNIHTGIRKYVCPFCDKAFVHSTNCSEHKKKVHPIEWAEMEATGTLSQKEKL